MQGEEIIKYNECSPGIYLILSGKVSISLSTESKVPILELDDSCFFGEFYLLDNVTENYYTVASKTVKCLFIPKESLNSLLTSNSVYLDRMKNLAIYKKAAIAIEELKFNDKISMIVKKMIEIKNEDDFKQ